VICSEGVRKKGSEGGRESNSDATNPDLTPDPFVSSLGLLQQAVPRRAVSCQLMTPLRHGAKHIS
jgi:hypothetical protein